MSINLGPQLWLGEMLTIKEELGQAGKTVVIWSALLQGLSGQVSGPCPPAQALGGPDSPSSPRARLSTHKALRGHCVRAQSQSLWLAL